MLSVRRKNDTSFKKLNLIPILDAVFIFIFFLLTAAQFIKFYNLETEAPIVSEITMESEKKPLNLIVEIDTETITLKKGLEETTFATYKKGPLPQNESKFGFDYESMQKRLIDLKMNHLKEKAAILRPTTSVKYKDLVELMDVVRGSKLKGAPVAMAKEKTLITNLFTQIIYE